MFARAQSMTAHGSYPGIARTLPRTQAFAMRQLGLGANLMLALLLVFVLASFV